MKRVLIVDDEVVFLQSLSEGLGSCSGDFFIVTAANGREALRILDSNHIDLVITDLVMPVMDGFEFLQRLRETHPDIPAMAMTAFCSDEVERRLLSLGVTRCFEKPIDFEDFAEKLRDEPLSRQRARSERIRLS